MVNHLIRIQTQTKCDKFEYATNLTHGNILLEQFKFKRNQILIKIFSIRL